MGWWGCFTALLIRKVDHALLLFQNHWFTYNETMTVESVTQAVSNLALQFGEEDADPGAMVSVKLCQVFLLFFGTNYLNTFLFLSGSSLVPLE